MVPSLQKTVTRTSPLYFRNSVCYCFSSTSKRSSKAWERIHSNTLFRYVKSLKWTPIPMGVGFAWICYQQYWHIRDREQRALNEGRVQIAHHWQLSAYRLLPLRTFSRLWGWVSNLDLPVWARAPVLTVFAKTFSCDVSEAAEEDLRKYRNLGDFFRRELKPNAREIHPGPCVVSPADGTVMCAGKVEKGVLEQVKGVTYSLAHFLGPITWAVDSFKQQVQGEEYERKLMAQNHNDTNLFYYVVYLKPGDYHRFHSPVNWEITHRRHFTGDLLSVKPGIARRFPGLFALNERSVYIGRWDHGFFSYTAVGATNVGSIKVYKDPNLTTNCKRVKKGRYCDYVFSDVKSESAVKVSKGELFGEFNLGSTIVIVFEAPSDFEFTVLPGQNIKVGQSLNPCTGKQNQR